VDWSLCLTRSGVGAELRAITLGQPLLDDYLAFVGARARPNTWLATAYDLKVFFTVVAKEPAQVTTADVFAFIAAQRSPRGDPKVVRLEDGESGLAARTIKRRLASVSGLFAYLVARGDAGVAANPVPRGLATRRAQTRPGTRGVALIRSPRTLPRVLSPDEVDRFMAALHTRRDRAMAEAMVLGALRRCEVLGLRLGDLHPGQRRLFIAEGKGGHQRIVPVSARVYRDRQDLRRHDPPLGANAGRVHTDARPVQPARKTQPVKDLQVELLEHARGGPLVQPPPRRGWRAAAQLLSGQQAPGGGCAGHVDDRGEAVAGRDAADPAAPPGTGRRWQEGSTIAHRSSGTSSSTRAVMALDHPIPS
jgi:integrase